MVLYCGSALFLAFVILAVAKSHYLWQFQIMLHDQVPSVLLDVVPSQGFSLPVTLIGSSALILEVQQTAGTCADLKTRFCCDPGSNMLVITHFFQVEAQAWTTLVEACAASCQLHVCTAVSVLTAAWSAVLSGDNSPWRG